MLSQQDSTTFCFIFTKKKTLGLDRAVSVLKSFWKCQKSKVHKISYRFGMSKLFSELRNQIFSSMMKNISRKFQDFPKSQMVITKPTKVIPNEIPGNSNDFTRKCLIRPQKIFFLELENVLTYQIDQKFCILSISDTFRTIWARKLPDPDPALFL